MNITATYEPADGRMVIEVTDAPVDTEPTITRLDGNGRREVRKPTATYAQWSPTSWRAYDREHALAGPVRYLADAGTARALTDATGLEHAPLRPLFSRPTEEVPNLEVLQVSGIEGTRTSSSTVHTIIGREAPAVTYGVLGTRIGTMTVLTDGYVHAARVTAALGAGRVHLLRQRDHPGLDMYFTTTAVTISPAEVGTRYWSVAVAYVEVGPPPGYSRGTNAWTWATLAAAHEDYTDVRTTYLTYGDMTEQRSF